jgi:hypothetical protein
MKIEGGCVAEYCSKVATVVVTENYEVRLDLAPCHRSHLESYWEAKIAPFRRKSTQSPLCRCLRMLSVAEDQVDSVEERILRGL